MSNKQCSKCKLEKPFPEFNKCKTGRLGLHNHCRLCQKECKKIWYSKPENREKEAQKAKLPENKAKQREKATLKYKTNKEYRESHLLKNKLRRRLEPAKIKARAYEKNKRNNDPNYKIGKCLRARLGDVLRKHKANKTKSTFELLGCSIQFFMKYMESKFLKGMTWENHGHGDDKWHIDHILPCDSFDLTDPEQQKICFHYTNLQPLWQPDNLSKSNKII